MPTQGSLTFNQHKADQPRGQYTLMASYKDKGGTTAFGPVTGSEVITLRNSLVRNY